MSKFRCKKIRRTFAKFVKNQDKTFLDFVKKLGKTFLDFVKNRYLFLLKEKRLKEKKSVIIFDEVQLFPQARQAIKYLVADGRYDYIETGSLISIRKNVTDMNFSANLQMLPKINIKI